MLARSESGFDSVRLLFQQDAENRIWAEQGRRFEYLVTWNRRRHSLADGIARADTVQPGRARAPGKRVALVDCTIERTWQQIRDFRLVVHLSEMTIDKKGPHLLFPAYQLEDQWIRLGEPTTKTIELYREHATHESIRGEFKSDLERERLPLPVNSIVTPLRYLALPVYNDQWVLTGKLSPVRHPAKRRHLKTVLPEIMCRVAQFIRSVRRLLLDVGQPL